ncbi:hypothetical protein DPMN_032351 [Dreissena polymorpha]|uniref:Uncharacterized protein n=1 Tax=Dreissena polymorpha TaxID=45954 RepID=A0A9D4RK61_DREPO|nr:hypothetical protein DPMN_032351 [Dreissena polymorpha]
MGNFFKISVGLSGISASPIMFNLSLVNVVLATIQEINISIGGRPISILRFADNIDVIGGTCSDHQDLRKRL